MIFVAISILLTLIAITGPPLLIGKTVERLLRFTARHQNKGHLP